MITVKKLSKVPLTFRPQLPSSHISDCIEVDTAKGHQIANFCELLPLLSFQNYSGTGNWMLRVLNAPKKGPLIRLILVQLSKTGSVSRFEK